MEKTAAMVHEEEGPGLRDRPGCNKAFQRSNDRFRMCVADGGIKVGSRTTPMVRMGKDADIGDVGGKGEFRTYVRRDE